MKRIFFILAAIFLGGLEARPIGNLAAPLLVEEGIFFSDKNWASFRLEGGANFLFNQNFKITNRPKSFFTKQSGSEFFSGLILNVKERFDGEAIYGKGEYHFRFSSKGKQYRAKVDSASFVELNGKLLLWEIGDFSFCFGGSASWVLEKKGSSQLKENFSNADPCFFKKKDWQTSFSLSYLWKYFSPYLGIMIYDAKAKLSVDQDPKVLLKMEAKEKIGALIGISFSPRRWFFFDVELMTIAEKNLSMKLDLRF